MERVSRAVHLIHLLTPLKECESIERMHVIGLLLSTRLGNETVDDTVPIFQQSNSHQRAVCLRKDLAHLNSDVCASFTQCRLVCQCVRAAALQLQLTRI